MTIKPLSRARLLAVPIVIATLAAVVAGTRAPAADAGYPCNTHYAAPATCSILGTLYIACSGATLRYSLSASSAAHGSPTVGTYYRYSGLTVGEFVNGSGYCLGISSSNWLLTDSGWISRTLAYIQT